MSRKTSKSSTIGGVCQRVIVLPESIVCGQDSSRRIVRIPHPKFGCESLFLIGSDSMLELTECSEECGSWFIDHMVEPDGLCYIATPYNLLYTFIFLFHKTDKFCLLKDRLKEENLSFLSEFFESKIDLLESIADVKEACGEKVYRINEEKTLEWLREKVVRVENVFRKGNIAVGGICRSSCLAATDNDIAPTNDDYKEAAFSIINDYIPEELGKKLQAKLGIELSKPKPKEVKSPAKKKRKTSSENEPIEDYANNSKKTADAKATKTVKLTLSQKRLQAADKTGMKSIASFFAKKS